MLVAEQNRRRLVEEPALQRRVVAHIRWLEHAVARARRRHRHDGALLPALARLPGVDRWPRSRVGCAVTRACTSHSTPMIL